MGMFGGKKDKESKKEEPTKRRRKGGATSRRVVAPGVKKGTGRESRVIARPSSGRKSANESVDELKLDEVPVPAAEPEEKAKPARVARKTQDAAAMSATPQVQEPTPAKDDVLELDLDTAQAPNLDEIEDVELPTGNEGVCRTGETDLFDFLVNKAGLIDDTQVEEIRQKAQAENLPADKAAVELGFFTEDELVSQLTGECWVPHLKVERYEIRKKALDTISMEDALYYGVLPVDKLGSILNLAMVNPLDLEAVAQIEKKTGLDIKKVVAARTEIEDGIAKYYGSGAEAAAKEGGLDIVQEVEEPIRATQMLRKANVRTTSEAGDLNEVVDEPELIDDDMELEATDSSDEIVSASQDDILDIDDLLSEDEEAIAPSVIEAVSISDEDLALDDDDDLAEPTVTAAFSRKKSDSSINATIEEPQISLSEETASAEDVIDIGFESEDTIELDEADFEEEPALVDEMSLDDDDVEKLDEGLESAASLSALNDSGSNLLPEPQVQPERPSGRVAIEANYNEAAAIEEPAVEEKVQPRLVELESVDEATFQRAISHKKSRVFEKWVAIQSRNRIINAIKVQPELDPILEPLLSEEVVEAASA